MKAKLKVIAISLSFLMVFAPTIHAAGKKKNFLDKHPVVTTILKVTGVAVVALGTYALLDNFLPSRRDARKKIEEKINVNIEGARAYIEKAGEFDDLIEKMSIEQVNAKTFFDGWSEDDHLKLQSAEITSKKLKEQAKICEFIAEKNEGDLDVFTWGLWNDAKSGFKKFSPFEKS